MSGEKDMEMSLFTDLIDPEDSEETDDLIHPLLKEEENSDYAPIGYRRRRTSNIGSHLTGNQPINKNLQRISETTSTSDLESLFVTDATEASSKELQKIYRRQRRLNTELLKAIEYDDVESVRRLLELGAKANATCGLDLISACHLAALATEDCVALLLQFEAQRHRRDKVGRTPLHFAAFVGNTRQMAFLLGLSKDMVDRLEIEGVSPSIRYDVMKISPLTSKMVNLSCDPKKTETVLPNNWQIDIYNKCKDIKLAIQPGWTPLHAAASAAKPDCVRLLLAAGADPNISDDVGMTALDVAGSEYYFKKNIDSNNFTEVLKVLISTNGTHNTMKLNGIDDVNTPLHTAVEVDNMNAIQVLLNAGVSVACRNVDGLSPMHICVKKELEATFDVLATYAEESGHMSGADIDIRDRKGYTVLQAAVEDVWISGVCKALETGADVTAKTNDGETLIHTAASSGHVEVLIEILGDIRLKDLINCQNDKCETPLFKAIQKNHIECVRVLLNKGASITITLPGDLNVLHVASQHGHTQILQYLLTFDATATPTMIDALSTDEKYGFRPIHFAVMNNHEGCVKKLLTHNANLMLKTSFWSHQGSTALHIAAELNYHNIAKIIIEKDKKTIHEPNIVGWYPLHTAAHHGNGEVIIMLLDNGADLSCYTDGSRKTRRSAVDMIVNNMIKPTQFLEDYFDSCISSNGKKIRDTDCEITINYSILTGISEINRKEDMNVMEALLDTGNRYNQRQLVLHPLVESFLHLKWKALLPFFYLIVVMNSIFVISFTIFIISVYFYKDSEEAAPMFWNQTFWGWLAFVKLLLMFVQELLYISGNPRKHLKRLNKWMKILSVTIAGASIITIHFFSCANREEIRHMSTLALLLAWLKLMFLLSRFPMWGYYVLMFEKVTVNVMKILLTFAFLIIGFSLSFMVQFHFKVPFGNPWSAFVKTLVMMTSEFDYMGLFHPENKDKLPPSLIIARLIFFSFLILAAVVLMNLLVGVAVKNMNKLEKIGNIRRLAKQVQFLATLNKLVNNKYFSTILPKKVCDIIINKGSVLREIKLYPGQPQNNTIGRELPSKIQEAIIFNVATQKKRRLIKTYKETYSKKFDAIHNAVVNVKKSNANCNIFDKFQRNSYPFTKYTLMTGRNDDDIENATVIKDIKDEVAELNVKMESLKQLLIRREADAHLRLSTSLPLGRSLRLHPARSFTP